MAANLSQRRAHAREGGRRIEARINEALAELEQQKQAERDARKPPTATHTTWTSEALQGARAVRDRFGWSKVIRVNRTSVTCATAYSWTVRIPLSKVIEARF